MNTRNIRFIDFSPKKKSGWINAFAEEILEKLTAHNRSEITSRSKEKERVFQAETGNAFLYRGSTGATRYAVFPRFIDPEKRIGYPVDTDAPLFAHEAFVTRVLGERKGTGREMMPSLQRGPAESILTPAQIDGPSSHVCLGLTALTYVSTLFLVSSPSNHSLSSAQPRTFYLAFSLFTFLEIFLKL